MAATRSSNTNPRNALERIPLAIRGPLYYLAFLAFILGLVPYGAWIAEQALGLSITLPLFARILGATLALIGLALYTTASIRLMKCGKGGYVEFDPPTEFVATGPFRWCRNPIAACVLVMLVGEAIAFSSIGMLTLVLIAAPLAHLQVVALEEPLLRKRFGDDYVRYCARVPRWIPRPPRASEAE